MVEKMTAQMGEAMGAEGDSSAMGMDMMGFLMDLPLLSIFHFQEQLLPIPPEEQVEIFLKETRG
jgi:beta-glucosidase